MINKILQVVVLSAMVTVLATYEARAQKRSDEPQYVPQLHQVLKGSLVGDDLIDDATLSLYPNDDPMQTPCSKLCAEYVELRITLSTAGVDQRLLKTSSAYEFSVSFKVRSKTGTSTYGTYPNIGVEQLTIDESGGNSKSTYVIDFTEKWKNNCVANQLPDEEIEIEIETVDDVNTSTAIRDSIRLEAEVFIRYKVHPYMDIAKFHYSTTPGPGLLPLATKVATVGATNIVEQNPIEFKWTYQNCSNWVPLHELQILRVHNEKQDYRVDNQQCEAPIDWSKAQRVFVYSDGQNPLHETKLTIAEGTGWYVWRVRPIGNYYPGGASNEMNFGTWSVAPAQNEVFDASSLTSISVAGVAASTTMKNSMFYYNQFDEDKNWAYKRAFFEDRNGGNGTAESMTYASSSLAPIQTQTLVHSTGDVILQHTVLDYEGRPTLVSLPAPKNDLASADNISYVYNPIGANSFGDLLEPKHFDKHDGTPLPFNAFVPNVNNGGVVSSYWGGEERVADDKGYPYVRTVLMNDPLGRVAEQTAAGEELANGDSGKRRTKTRYANVTENEMVAVFGRDAPVPDLMRKVITTDPNGVVSYSYIDDKDRVVATCLAVGATGSVSNMNQLSTENQYGLVVVDTVKNGSLKKGSLFITSSKTLEVSSTRDYAFDYFLEHDVFEYFCTGDNEQVREIDICQTCDYEITVSLYEVGGPDPPVERFKYTYQLDGVESTSCTTQSWSVPSTPTTLPKSVELHPGTYRMVRTIKPLPAAPGNPTAIEAVIEEQRTEHVDMVEDVLQALLTGSDPTEQANLAEFMKRTATTEEGVRNREKWARTMLERYLQNHPPTSTEPDTTVKCCNLVFPIIDCPDPCAENIDYEQMLFAEIDNLTDAQKTVLFGNTTVVDDLRYLIWYYGAENWTDPATPNSLMVDQLGGSINGEINELFANMKLDGYDCEELYNCWTAAVKSYSRLAFVEVTRGVNQVLERNESFNFLDYFLDCAGTKYCSLKPISQTVDANDEGWVRWAYKVLPEYFADYNDNGLNDCVATIAACNGTNDAAIDQLYRELRGCYKGAALQTYDALTQTVDEDRQAHVLAKQYGPNLVPMPCIGVDSDQDMENCIREQLQELEDKCKSKCEAYRSQFLRSLRNYYLQNGYAIAGFDEWVPKNPNGQTVSMAKLLCITTALYDDCVETCDLPLENLTFVQGVTSGVTQQEIDAVSEIVGATGFSIEFPDQQGNCPPPTDRPWKRITRGTKISDFLVELLNLELERFQLTMEAEWLPFNVRPIIEELGPEYPAILDCINSADPDDGWWGGTPYGIVNPNDPFRVLVKRGDKKQRFKIDDEDPCQIVFVEADREAPSPYDSKNPHPVVKLLNRYLHEGFSTTVDDDILLLPEFDDYTSSTFAISGGTYEIIEITNDGFVLNPINYGTTTINDPLAPEDAEYFAGTKPVENSWQLANINLECIKDPLGNDITVAQLSDFLNIKSHAKQFIRLNNETVLHPVGVYSIQPCNVAGVTPTVPLGIDVVTDGGDVLINGQYWWFTNFVKENIRGYSGITMTELQEMLSPDFLAQYVWFSQTDDGYLSLTFSKDSEWGANNTNVSYEYIYDCFRFQCKAPYIGSDTCQYFKICNACSTVACTDVCFQWTNKLTSVTPRNYVKPNSCAVDAIETIIQSVESQLNGSCWPKIQEEIKISYQQSCFDPLKLKDGFTATASETLGHYTLYYYDQAGRLVKTVPPQGVKFVNVATTTPIPRTVVPNHEYVTTYAYNTLGQMVQSNTPDGGSTTFWYNNVGQLRLSQNAKQLSNGVYSYTNYDDLGRITEVGQRALTGDPQTAANAVPPYFTTSGTHVVRTVYTDATTYIPLPWNGSKAQKNLLNRISYTISDLDGDFSSNSEDDRVTTYYSYDAHGNVDWLIQELPGISGSAAQSSVLIDYEYDLISGQVVEVRQNHRLYDQVFRRYTYDSDGKILTSSSSLDGTIWDDDAKYEYFRHGPLKRLEIGEDSLQGVDYTYTINGWLKGINVPTINVSQDPGQDGYATGTMDNNYFGRDAFGMELHYYTDDFSSSSTIFTNNDAPLHAKPLYNGNIAGWSWNSRGTTSTANPPTTTLGAAYTYDVLNRIAEQKMFTLSGTTWTNPNANFWKTSYSYDGNGNIKTLSRHDEANTQFDDFTYTYDATPNNRLTSVTDNAATSTTPTTDIEGTHNYTYDAIGNLTSDVSEGITSITWTPANKIEKIVKTGEEIRYLYDAMGNRVRTQIWTGSSLTSTTWYVRDPQGNPLAIYKKGTFGLESYPDVTLCEVPLYGSDRLGVIRPNIQRFGNQQDTINREFKRYAGQRNYELTDHLGNVRVVISDELDELTASSGEFVADVVSHTDYYPFGYAMESRTGNQADYRYGFNGQEKSLEVDANGNHNTAPFWEYDSRIARRWNLDPRPVSHVGQYSPFEGSPIQLIDSNGDTAIVSNKDYPDGVSIRTFSTSHLQSQLNSKMFDWANPMRRTYAPKVAQYLRDNEIPVVLASTTENGSLRRHDPRQPIYVSTSVYAGTVRQITGTLSYLDKTWFHEIVHRMDEGNDEFQARAAVFAVGYATKSEVLDQFTNTSSMADGRQYYQYIQSGMPESFEKYFEYERNDRGTVTKVTINKPNEFLRDLYNEGSKIIGTER